MQDVGTRLETEHVIVQFDVARRLAVDFLDLHLHGSALLVLVRAGVGCGRIGGVFGVGTGFLLFEQGFLLFGGNFGTGFVLGRTFNEACISS